MILLPRDNIIKHLWVWSRQTKIVYEYEPNVERKY